MTETGKKGIQEEKIFPKFRVDQAGCENRGAGEECCSELGLRVDN